ncbi:MAG: hypothetical protein IKX30_03825 [Victivallales bacterium]|nr:hypothetical protein [Victivallales bacterium]
MKHLFHKFFFWNVSNNCTFFSMAMLMALFAIGLLNGCVSMSETGRKSSRTKTVPTETLLHADLSDASSCFEAGKQRYRMAMEFHKSGDKQQAKAFMLEAIKLLELAVASRSKLDFIETELISRELIFACKDAKEIYAEEPEIFQAFCRRTIQYINSRLPESPQNIISHGDLEYQLVVLYLLIGDEEKAFLAAEDAWRNGCRNWDGDVRKQLRKYMFDNHIVASHLPPPRPCSTLQGKMLFPINVLPDILVDVVCCTGYGFYAAGNWLASGNLVVGIFALGGTPLVMPIAGCVKGVDDAWRGLPFWNLTPMWQEEF